MAPEQNPWPMGWLIWRYRLSTRYRSLTVDEAWALDATREGADFAGLCAGLCEWVDEEQVAARALEMVGRWIGDGVVTEIAAGG